MSYISFSLSEEKSSYKSVSTVLSKWGSERIRDVYSINGSSIYQEEPSVPKGRRGFKEYKIQVDHARMPGYHILIYLSVRQGASKNQDIRFYIFDESNYDIWLKMLEAIEKEERDYPIPHPSVNVPRIIHGELRFKPPNNGTYYAVLDNTYSRLMSKSVSVKIAEIWHEPLTYKK